MPTEFKGSLQIKRRLLKYALSFNSSKNEETPIDQPPPSKKCKLDDSASSKERIHSFQNTSPTTFELIALFAFKNEKSETLHFLRLVCRDFYILSSSINQSRLFSKVDQKKVTFIESLTSSGSMLRYRYINGVDYGMDGQYFTQDCRYSGYLFGSLAAGDPVSYSPPRTQPNGLCQWIVNVKEQCLESVDHLYDETDNFWWKQWLIYVIHNVLDPEYILNGSIGFREMTVTVGTVGEIDNVIQGPHGRVNKKEKDRIWNPFTRRNTSEQQLKTMLDAINDKAWIAAHQNIKNGEELMALFF